jgi:hypothetical protein
MEPDREFLIPYDYEPLAENTENSQTEGSQGGPDDIHPLHFLDDPDSDRLDNRNWCQCGNCEAMPTGKECFCCQELDALNDKFDTGINCICDHDDFETVCLHRAVLRTALSAMADVAAETVTEPLTNK